ncbi:MAG: hypothetical protein QOE18_509 [Chloroflexota bacterium]|nr:hypothetical protein [Chloroflexota bacterium]
MTEVPGDEGSAGEGQEQATEAAVESVDGDRLLAGEDEGTPYAADVLHWINVYSELLDFKRYIIGVTEERVPSMGPASAAEVTGTDLKILRTEAERFARRLVYWRGRAAAIDEQSDSSL